MHTLARSLIAIDLGRKLKWDPAHELFIGDQEANARLPLSNLGSAMSENGAISAKFFVHVHNRKPFPVQLPSPFLSVLIRFHPRLRLLVAALPALPRWVLAS